MLTIHKILCPIDFSPTSLQAAKYAIALAHRYRARLLFVHVVEPFAPWVYEFPLPPLAAAVTGKSAAELNKLAKQARMARVRAEVLVRRGLVDVAIQSAIRTQGVDFVVMGTHGRRHIEKFFLGSTADQLLRKLQVPLLTMRRGSLGAAHAIRNILVTTDLSEGTANAIAYALSIAKKYSATVTLLHILNDVQADISGGYREQLIRGIESNIENLIPAEGRNTCTVRVLTGQPFRRILHLVKSERIDLIVMNIHSKTVADRLTIGSTAEKIIRTAEIPVLAVPSSFSIKRKARKTSKAA